MKLRDLDANFLGDFQLNPAAAGFNYRDIGESIEGAQGVQFQCPLCAQNKEVVEEDGRRFVRGAHSVICWFRNPRGAQPVPADAVPGPGRWWAEGTGIDDLTFTHGEPSMAKSVLLTSGCGWHGFVENGEAA